MPSTVTLSPSLLLPHPQNPRPRLTEFEVNEVRSFIEAYGQRHPWPARLAEAGPVYL